MTKHIGDPGPEWRAQQADLRELEAAIATARAELGAAVKAKRHVLRWSWARIGRELGVSRQAAWERFHRETDAPS